MFKLILDGRLTRDAELRITDTGHKVCNFTVAVDGFDKQKVTYFVECAIWGERAAKIVEYLTKGLQVFCIGECNMRSWQKGTASGTNYCCNVESITLGGLPKGQSAAVNDADAPPFGGGMGGNM